VNDSLQALLEGAQVWRAREKGTMPAARRSSGGTPAIVDSGLTGAHDVAGASASLDAHGVLPTGWPALDAALPDGGWPLGTLIELLLPAPGVGELQLLVPALRAAGTRRPQGWLAWIAPPLAPYPPALAQAGLDPGRVLLVDAATTQDRLWAMEQALHSRSCGAVLAWLDDVDDRWLRRLKLAAEPARTLTIVFRPLARRAHASPAALRLVLEPADGGIEVEVVKGRGGPRRVGRVPVAA
jgi:cell division inhibitor SulA/protein ImuA